MILMNYEKRKTEFIWYHIHGDGDCNGQVLRVYARENALSEQDCFDLSYFYATTYCCASAIFLLGNRQKLMEDVRGFADEYKGKLIFQSDRKYVRMLDNFSKMLLTWREGLNSMAYSFRDRFVEHGVVNTKNAIAEAEKWYYFSRFSAYLFVETYCDIMNLKATRETGMCYEGDNMTFAGGLFYVYGMDEEAKYVQENHKLPTDITTFEYLIHDLQNAVRMAGGDDNFTKLETSLCAYEKFFKGSRYNGYYADRQLQELVKMQENAEFVEACNSVYKARKDAINVFYRGEDKGWNGIRPWLKKHYKNTGKVFGIPDSAVRL